LQSWSVENTLRLRNAPMIVKDPKTCGGMPCIAGTRIGVHDIVSGLRRLFGNTEALLAELPHLNETQVTEAMAYYEANAEEIDEVLLEREEAYRRGLNPSRGKRQRTVAIATR
jgi:uncharacterized protein (DUF433 family)